MTEKSMVSLMCGVQLKNAKAKDMMASKISSLWQTVFVATVLCA